MEINSLYADDSVFSFKKEAGVSVGENPSEWPSEVTKEISNQHPYIAERIMGIRFEKTDESKGSGTGAAIVSDGKEKIIVPIVIKNGELEPLDVFIYNKKVYHLSPIWISKIFSKSSGIKGLAKPTRKVEKYRTGFIKAASSDTALDVISNMVREKDKAQFIADATKNTSIITSFVNNGNKEILDKVDKLKPVSGQDLIKGLARVLPKESILVKKGLPNEYSIECRIGGTREATSYERGDAMKELERLGVGNPAQVIDLVDKKGYTVIAGKDSGGELAVASPVTVLGEKLQSQGSFTAKDSQGRDFPGYLFPVVVDFDLNNTGKKLFVTKSNYGLQDSIAGTASSTSTKVPISVAEKGKFGFMIYGPGAAKIATCPFSIDNIVASEKHTLMSVTPDEGRLGKTTLIVTPGISTIVKVDDVEDDTLRPFLTKCSYLVPEGMDFIELGPRVPYARSSEEFEKLSAAVLRVGSFGIGNNRPSLEVMNKGETYTLRGPALKGVPFELKSNVDSETAKKQLIVAGMTSAAAASALTMAKDKGSIEIQNFSQLEDFKKQASRFTSTVEENFDLEKINLIKEAAILDNKEDAENLLSMYFVSPENYYFYVEAIPHLEATSERLAKLLLSSKLGLNTIPRNALKKSLDSLDVMINKLNEAKLKLHGSSV